MVTNNIINWYESFIVLLERKYSIMNVRKTFKKKES
jgi:hypothetical protein